MYGYWFVKYVVRATRLCPSLEKHPSTVQHLLSSLRASAVSSPPVPLPSRPDTLTVKRILGNQRQWHLFHELLLTEVCNNRIHSGHVRVLRSAQCQMFKRTRPETELPHNTHFAAR